MADQRALSLIQEEKHDAFNTLVKATGGRVDLSGAHLRAYDLRKFDLSGADLSGAYLKHADLRGLDLGGANLSGASMREAKVSGVLFPRNLSPQEIMMSLQHGTRLRCQQQAF
jgi:uncharacterized protein YjbI with pentapeptide repeats